VVLEQSYKSLIASQHHSCHHRVLEPLRKWPEFQPTKANLLGPLVLVVTEVWWIEVLKAMPIIVTQACESLDVGIVAVLQHTHSITTPSPAFTLLGPLTVKVVSGGLRWKQCQPFLPRPVNVFIFIWGLVDQSCNTLIYHHHQNTLPVFTIVLEPLSDCPVFQYKPNLRGPLAVRGLVS
jgi:hypothetical protein